jgi:hypothetical protein
MEPSSPSTQIQDFGETAERENEELSKGHAKTYKEVISTFPEVKGFWDVPSLGRLMSVQEHF